MKIPNLALPVPAPEPDPFEKALADAQALLDASADKPAEAVDTAPEPPAVAPASAQQAPRSLFPFVRLRPANPHLRQPPGTDLAPPDARFDERRAGYVLEHSKFDQADRDWVGLRLRETDPDAAAIDRALAAGVALWQDDLSVWGGAWAEGSPELCDALLAIAVKAAGAFPLWPHPGRPAEAEEVATTPGPEADAYRAAWSRWQGQRDAAARLSTMTRSQLVADAESAIDAVRSCEAAFESAQMDRANARRTRAAAVAGVEAWTARHPVLSMLAAWGLRKPEKLAALRRAAQKAGVVYSAAKRAEKVAEAALVAAQRAADEAQAVVLANTERKK